LPDRPAPDHLRPLLVAELEHLDRGMHWRIDQMITGLATLTPVRGELQATHLGNVLELRGRAEAIVTLCCDRCLKHFNQILSASSTELIWIGVADQEGAELAGRSAEGDASQLMERLDPGGYFDPERWIFEQLSLQLPTVNRCGGHCQGPASWGSPSPGPDPRWQALEGLRP